MDFSSLKEIDWQAISSFLTLIAVIIALSASMSVSRQIRAEKVHMLGEIRACLGLIILELGKVIEKNKTLAGVIVRFGENSVVKRNAKKIQQSFSEKGHLIKNRWIYGALIDASVYAKLLNDFEAVSLRNLEEANKDMKLIQKDLAWKSRFLWLKKRQSRITVTDRETRTDRRTSKTVKEVFIDR